MRCWYSPAGVMHFADRASSACGHPYVSPAPKADASKRIVLVAALLAAATGIPARVRAQDAADDGQVDADADADQSLGIVLDNAAFEQRLAQSEALVRNSQPTVQVGGYVDFGFFIPEGNGSGYVEDFGHVDFPGYSGQFGWVFLGDILAPAVNTRGEVADLGPAPGVNRYDSINSRGAPGFILNEVNLALRSALTPTALVSASINFAPRTGSDFALGDAFDVDIAQVEWLPTASQRTSIFVGKMDPVFGIEYRDRKSDRRFGITPSLMARYTIGTALGLKLRTKFGSGDWLVLAVALTNGSNTTEQFHFYDEIDSNVGKTASARLSVRLPLSIEIGASGSVGPQDRATDTAELMWFYGFDLLAHRGRFDVKGQWMTGHAAGKPSQGVYGLDLNQGGYLELDVMLTPSLGVLGRGEYRDAFVWLADQRAYLTKSWRATVGLRWVLTSRAVLKAEYLQNGEYGGIPNIANNIFTTSLVMGF
jgi:hypothetical protein